MSKSDVLYKFLSSKKKGWYSYTLGYTSRKTGISTRRINKLFESKCFEERYNDSLNIFKYNGIKYIGLGSRRLDYENDKVLGKNKVEKLIDDGYYD